MAKARAIAESFGVGVSFVDPALPLHHSQVYQRASLADIVILGRDCLGKAEVELCSNLQHVVKYGVGIDNIDTHALQHAGISLHWRPGVNARQVAELTIGLMISLLRNIRTTNMMMSQGKWLRSGGTDLGNKSVCLLGCGHVGEIVAKLLKAFGCDIYVVDVLDKSTLCESSGYRQVSLREGLEICDILSIHVPLTDQTRGLIGLEELKLLGEEGYVFNTARGEVLPLLDLKAALSGSLIKGAGLDVFDPEPFFDQELLGMKNFVATPHIGGGSLEAKLAMGFSALSYVEEILI